MGCWRRETVGAAFRGWPLAAGASGPLSLNCCCTPELAEPGFTATRLVLMPPHRGQPIALAEIPAHHPMKIAELIEHCKVTSSHAHRGLSGYMGLFRDSK